MRRHRVEFIISFVLAVAVTFGLCRLQAARSLDAIAHDHAEHVLWPAFVSAMNAWVFNHPMSDPQHLHNLDVKDLKRFEAARKAWKEFDEEMKLGGY